MYSNSSVSPPSLNELLNVRLIRPWALYVRLLILAAAFTWMWSMTRASVLSILTSALLSAFLSNSRRISALFFGQRPWDPAA